MLAFESQWRWLVNGAALSNLQRSQDDSHFGAGLSQLMGDPPNNTAAPSQALPLSATARKRAHVSCYVVCWIWGLHVSHR